MSGATSVLQQSINAACKSPWPSDWASINIKAGTYPVEQIRIPPKCKTLITTWEQARIVHTGRRRHPLFILEEGSLLKLENLELEYKGKETYMFQGRRRNPDNVIFDNVKIVRAHVKASVKAKASPSGEQVSPEQLLKYLKQYVQSYRLEYQRLTQDPPNGAGYPKVFGNKAYIDSKHLRAYILRNAVVIADVVNVPATQGYEPDRSAESMPSVTSTQLEDGTTWDVVLAKYSLNGFISLMTMGMFNVQQGPIATEFGRYSALATLTLQNSSIKKERHVSSIVWYPYTDKSGWDSRNSWIYAFYDLRYDVASSLAGKEGAGKVYKVDGKDAITAIPTDTIWRENEIRQALGAKLRVFSKDIDDLRGLLEKSASSVEQVFLDFIANHLHLLDLYATKIEPSPFIDIPEEKPSTIKGTRRVPDFIASYADGTYMLIELEKASKPVLIGRDNRPSHELTQALNQTSEWNEMIRNFGNYLLKYPSLTNHRNLIVIGREAGYEGTRQEFHNHLNRINQDFSNAKTTIITYDDLVSRAQAARSRITAIQTMIS